MSALIIERLNARLASDNHPDDLFTDLQDARDAIEAGVAENMDLKDRLSAPPASPTTASSAVPPSGASEAITLLREGKARLEVHALSDVGLSMDGAIKILGG